MIAQKQLFDDLHKLLNDNGIEHWAICGTLLGIIREDNFISHDADVDLACHTKDYWKVRQIITNSSDWQYYRIWHRELALWHGERKIDLFFMDSDDTRTYIYSYKLNSFTGRWDTCWRSYFNKEDYFPLKKRKFLDTEILIPNNPEKILTTHYGDWKTPNKNWSVKDMTNIDKDYRQIGFIIPTFLRPDKVQKCIESIYKTFPRDWYRIHVGDQEGNKRYDYLQVDDNFYSLDYNNGLAKTRQFLIDQAKEPFLIIMDDDFIFTKETDLNSFIRILLEKEEHGIVGGQLKNYNHKPVFSYLYNLRYTDKIIKKIEIQPKYIKTLQTRSQFPQLYCYGDLILNFSMAKKEVFQTIQYDSNFKLVEHLDFFLRLKQQNQWKVCFTPNVYADHQGDNNSEEYTKYRHWQTGQNVLTGYSHFHKKWGIKLQNVKLIKLESKNRGKK